MQSSEYDAIVVGSGISGGWAAKELTEKGLRVLLLERGRNIEHIKDYVNATKAPWEYPHRGGRTRAMEELYPVLKRDYPLNEKNLDFWVDDEGVAVHRGQALRLVPRLPGRRTFAHVGAPELPLQRVRFRGERARRHRHRLAHSLRGSRALVRSRRAARGDRGLASKDMPQLPDGQFQPAMPLNCGEELVAGRLTKLFNGRRRIIPGRTANAHPAAARPRRLPVPQRVLAGLPVTARTSARSRRRCRPPWRPDA